MQIDGVDSEGDVDIGAGRLDSDRVEQKLAVDVRQNFAWKSCKILSLKSIFLLNFEIKIVIFFFKSYFVRKKIIWKILEFA